ncbi:helix-turn-helix domain-containing protein [Saccharospirillum mangrovi]|uniref:helix-turn-helix domain-containing protein n=1 Tax=Saccharospirillum mangrovi TaxID=2161747 RepID=UPI001E45BA03|nr:helix-turn-helix domain-containing protein [Saccharospirillum mangrovi]
MNAEVNRPNRRLRAILAYIHRHLETPLNVESLAQQAGWSRWQFQRVFGAQTGLSVAQYVRELRLSRAAEALLTSTRRQLDIALECGFDSEISFNRAFKQVFGCTPGDYRRRGERNGLKTPIRLGEVPLPPEELNPRLLQIRVETRAEMHLVGLCDSIDGLFSPQPNFADRVPALWHRFMATLPLSECTGPLYGVLEVHRSTNNGHSFPYWAATQYQGESALPEGVEPLTVPAQQYAAIPFHGPIQALDKTLAWFLQHWLPGSGYRALYGVDLEVYQPELNLNRDDTAMEYWVPIEPDVD